MSFSADTTLADSKELIEALKKAGWKTKEAYRSKPRQDHKPDKVLVFSREICHPKAIKNVTVSDSVTTKFSENNATARDPSGGSNQYGSPIAGTAPETLPAPPSAGCDLSEIASIDRMRLIGNSFVLALDSEFYYNEKGERMILTWQVTFTMPSKPERIQEIVFASVSGKRIPISFILSWILDNYDLAEIYPDGFMAIDYRKARKYVYHTVESHGVQKTHFAKTVQEAYEKSTLEGEREILALSMPPNKEHRAVAKACSENGKPYVDTDNIVDGYLTDPSLFKSNALHITLLCHAAKADIPALMHKDFDDFLPRLADIQGGLVSLSDFRLYPPSVSSYNKFYPLRISVRDTMCYAPAGHKTLRDLGKTIGIPKLDVASEDKNNMLDLLKRDPASLFEYAANDSVIALCFAGELWGYNTNMPVTVSSAAVKAAIAVLENHFCLSENSKSFDLVFRGLHKEKKGLSKKADKAGYIQNTALEPVNDAARNLQNYAQLAYKGGYNASIIIGKYDGILTHDYDLENAYPTCMSIVPDVDWEGTVIEREITGRALTLEDIDSPFDLMFGYIKFRFPGSVKFPCIPIAENGSMIFPLSSDAFDGVYASGPEIYLALQLCAEIYAERVYVGRKLRTTNSSISYSLRAAVKQFVTDRKMVQKKFGKKSLLDLLMKTAVNSLYGKTAQDLIDKSSWNAWTESMENIGGSAITSPTHACLTTAGVRCVLIAAMNQLDSLGYKTYSVTTDGFITDAPEDILNGLDLFGFSKLFRSARQALVGSDEMWSEKHHQTDLLNFTTRGNVSLSPKGVCAHNSFVTGFEKDSYLDSDKLSVNEKITWINRFNKSGKKFTKNTWKDCRKPERVHQMIDHSLLKDTLNDMQNYTKSL